MPANNPKRIHALWCHPRSMSTAFERVMRERGDLSVLHEPFLYYYYLSDESPNRHLDFADFNPNPDKPVEYSAIRDSILEQSKSNILFFKDMAFYIVDRLQQDPEFANAMTHTFLIRDPAQSIVSYYHRDPKFTCDETGYKAQWELYEWLKSSGHHPGIVDSHALRLDPNNHFSNYWKHVGLADKPDALQWQNNVPDDWQAVEDWHRDAINSGSIRPPDTTRDYHQELATLGSPYTNYEAFHRPYYEKLLRESDKASRG